jgi:hypothetical protein
MSLTKRWFDEVIERRRAPGIALDELASLARDEISVSRTDSRFSRQVDRLAAMLEASGYSREQIEAALWAWLDRSVARLVASAGDCSFNHSAFKLPAPAFEHEHRCTACGAEVTCVKLHCVGVPTIAHDAHA